MTRRITRSMKNKCATCSTTNLGWTHVNTVCVNCHLCEGLRQNGFNPVKGKLDHSGPVQAIVCPNGETLALCVNCAKEPGAACQRDQDLPLSSDTTKKPRESPPTYSYQNHHLQRQQKRRELSKCFQQTAIALLLFAALVFYLIMGD